MSAKKDMKTMKKSKSVKKSMKKSKSMKKTGNCKVMKKMPESSPKFLEVHKKLLLCGDDKCKEFLDKDIEIAEKCIDKVHSMKISKLNDERRLKVLEDCYKNMGLVPNILEKVKCINKKCSSEMNKFDKFPFSEHNQDAVKDFSNFEREKSRIQEKNEKYFPELKEINKLNNKIELISNAFDNCKSESKKKKLKADREKLYSKVAQFFTK
jgi:hypothetical protein